MTAIKRNPKKNVKVGMRRDGYADGGFPALTTEEYTRRHGDVCCHKCPCKLLVTGKRLDDPSCPCECHDIWRFINHQPKEVAA